MNTKCPFHSPQSPIVFKDGVRVLELHNIQPTQHQIRDKILAKLDDGTIGSGIVENKIGGYKKDTIDRMVETEIFWLVMKHVIEIVMYSAISQVQNEQQISTNCHHQSFISISDWEKLYKATTLRKRLTIICNTLWIYFATEVKQVLIKLLHEASEGKAEDIHLLIRLVSLISKENGDVDILNGWFWELFVEIGIDSAIENTASMVEGFIKGNPLPTDKTLEHCRINSRSLIIDSSRSRVFIEEIMKLKPTAIRYNLQENKWEWNISEDELEASTNSEGKGESFVSCPMLFWKTEFYGEPSNGILDFQHLLFDMFRLCLERAGELK